MSTEKKLVITLVGLAVAIGAVIFWPEPAPEPAPAEPEREPPSTDPCDQRAENREAEPPDAGPFDDLSALCEDWRAGASCERIEPEGSDRLPFDASLIRRAPEEDDDEGRVALVLTVDGALYRRDVGRPFEDYEDHVFEARTAHDEHPYVLAKLTFVRRFEHQPGNPEGPVQVITRRTWYACGVGPSEAPSCVEIPLHFRRETLRPGEPPTDVAETALSAELCDNGLLLYEGSTDRLTGRNEEQAESLQGLGRLVFL